MTRLAFYSFYEKNGIVRDYVMYYLHNLKEIAQDIVVIANGLLSEKGRSKLEALGAEILVRENTGFDFAAWKAALELKRQEVLSQYDQLILCNCSCYGPVYPFAEVFDVMKKHDCDFWGLYRHPAINGLFPSHLQSYFLVIRKPLLDSQDFADYWQSFTPAENRKEAFEQESHFTYYFEERGFTSCSYIEECESEKLFVNPIGPLTHKLLVEDNFPLIKRTTFIDPYEFFFNIENVSQANETLKSLQTTTFPISYIYDDIIHTMKNSDIRKILHHTFVLQDKNIIVNTELNEKIAIIVFSYYADLVEEDISYIQNMPPESDVYIVVVSENLQKIWELRKYELRCKNVFIRKQINRGRNENAYWLTCRDVIEGYDFICVAHDKKTPSAKPAIKGYYFSRHCWDNILKSPAYVNSIIELMRRKPELGILMPPTLVFGGWADCILNNEWVGNRHIAEDIYKRLNMTVPFDEHPDAPWGAMFWLRGKAMAPFYRYNWTIEDFPEEPIRVSDGTILHALERMYPMIAQEAGYFSAWIMPESEAGVHFDNMYHLAKQKAAQLDFMSGSSAQSHPSVQNYDVQFKTIRRMIKAYLKKKWHKLFRKR